MPPARAWGRIPQGTPPAAKGPAASPNRSDDKRRARLNAIRVFLHSIEYAEKDEEQIGAVDGLIVKSVPEYLRGYRR